MKHISHLFGFVLLWLLEITSWLFAGILLLNVAHASSSQAPFLNLLLIALLGVCLARSGRILIAQTSLLETLARSADRDDATQAGDSTPASQKRSIEASKRRSWYRFHRADLTIFHLAELVGWVLMALGVVIVVQSRSLSLLLTGGFSMLTLISLAAALPVFAIGLFGAVIARFGRIAVDRIVETRVLVDLRSPDLDDEHEYPALKFLRGTSSAS